MDIHAKCILAAIIDHDGTTAEHRSAGRRLICFALNDWVLLHNCHVVVCGSTSDYWVQVYCLFEDQFPVIVGNTRDIKALSHKKTDKFDAPWIAKLVLLNQTPLR